MPWFKPIYNPDKEKQLIGQSRGTLLQHVEDLPRRGVRSPVPMERVSGQLFGARVVRPHSISPGPGQVRNSSPRMATLFQEGMGHSRSPFRPRYHPTKQLLADKPWTTRTFDYRTPGDFQPPREDAVQRLKIVDLAQSLSYINAKQERSGDYPNAIFSTQPASLSGGADLSTGLTTRRMFHGQQAKR